MKNKLPKLTQNQIKCGALWLAASNLGMEMKNPKSTKDVLRQWHQLQANAETDEMFNAFEVEGNYWEKLLKQNDDYCVKTIMEELPFLFTK